MKLFLFELDGLGCLLDEAQERAIPRSFLDYLISLNERI